jgi:hypothetical protein
MKLMDILNPDGCFMLPEVSIDLSLTLPADWLAQLSVLVEDHLSEGHEMLKPHQEDTTVTILKYRLFQVHIHGSYTQAGPLIESLQFLLHCFNAQDLLSSDEKAAISVKLAEGIEQCSSGFHDRANDIILGIKYKQENITLYLYHYRYDLVLQARIRHTHEVHANNRFFQLANSSGCGVFPLSTVDTHPGRVSNETILETLDVVFSESYTPLKMMDVILERIETKLRQEGAYQGVHPSGYTEGEYREWNKIVSSLLGQDVPTGQYLLFDETTSKVTDLKWSALGVTILTHFFERNILKATHQKAVIDYISSVIDRDEEDEVLPLPSEAIDVFLLSPEERYLFQQRFPQIGALGIQALWACYREEISSDRFLIDTLLSATTDEKEKANQLNKLRAIPTSEWVAQFNQVEERHGLNTLMIAADSSPTLLPVLYRFLSELNKEELAVILQHVNKYGDNIIMDTVCIELIGMLKERHPELLMRMMLQANKYGQNALMLAIRHYPGALPTLVAVMKEMQDVTFSYEVDAALERTHKANLNGHILNQTDVKGRNALMLAEGRGGEILSSIFELIWRLAEEKKMACLSTLNAKGWVSILNMMLTEPVLLLDVLSWIGKQETAGTTQLKTNWFNMIWYAIAKSFMKKSPCRKVLIDYMKCQNKETIIELLAAWNEGENIVFSALKNDSELAAVLLELMETFEASDIQRIFSQEQAPDNENILMVGIIYAPHLLRPIFDLLLKLPTKERIFIGSYLDDDGSSVLGMAASSKTQDALSTVLEWVNETLSKKDITRMLMHENHERRNPIMLALRSRHQDVSLLMAIIKELDREKIGLILSKTDCRSQNALQLAIVYSPKVLKALCELIKCVAPQVLSTLIGKMNTDYQNALMVALAVIQKKPDTLSDFLPLFDLIKELELKEQEALCFQFSIRKRNVLETLLFTRHVTLGPLIELLERVGSQAKFSLFEKMIGTSIHEKTKYIEALLMWDDNAKAFAGLMSELTSTDVVSLFFQTIYGELSALSLAVRRDSKAVPFICELLKRCDVTDKLRFLNQGVKKDQNPLSIAIAEHPEHIPTLCDFIETLTPREKKNVHPKSAMLLAAVNTCPAYAERIASALYGTSLAQQCKKRKSLRLAVASLPKVSFELRDEEVPANASVLSSPAVPPSLAFFSSKTPPEERLEDERGATLLPKVQIYDV